MVHTDSWIIEGRKLIECVCGRAEEGGGGGRERWSATQTLTQAFPQISKCVKVRKENRDRAPTPLASTDTLHL